MARTEHFTLQLASYPTAEEAEIGATELRTNGVRVEILMTLLDDHKISYRVRAGKFPSMLKARTQGEIWRAYGWIKTYWVTKVEGLSLAVAMIPVVAVIPAFSFWLARTHIFTRHQAV